MNRFYYFATATVAIVALGSIFMVAQCNEKEAALYSQAALVCASGGGTWVEIIGQTARCYRPSR